MSCPACDEHRLHTEEDWKNHPDRGHGYTKEWGWTMKTCVKCGFPKSAHRPEASAHHSECTLEDYRDE